MMALHLLSYHGGKKNLSALSYFRRLMQLVLNIKSSKDMSTYLSSVPTMWPYQLQVQESIGLMGEVCLPDDYFS